MPQYRRSRLPGGCYFFTVALADRRKTHLTDHIDALRDAIRWTRNRRSFEIEAMVVLPEHLHCIWSLPEGDADYSSRWKIIKARFSGALPRVEARSRSRFQQGERGIWQRRFWEHTIQNELDYERHVDYIHFNPVKHGYVAQAGEWAYSSFGRFVAQGSYPADWGGGGGHVDLALE